MPLFKDPDTGEVSNFEGEAAIAAAQAGFIAQDGGSVQLVRPGGSEVSIATSDLGRYTSVGRTAAVDPAAQTAARYDAKLEERLQERHGGAADQALTFGEGALNSFTLGGYNAFAKSVGLNTDKRAKASPGVNVGGELIGLGVSLATGAGPAGALFKGTGALGKSIGGLKGAVAGEALEGAISATTHALSNAYVQDKKLTAETLFSEVGRDALFGAGIGGTGAALAHGLAKYGGKLVDSYEGQAAPILDLSTDEGRRVAKGIAGAIDDLDRQAGETIEAVEAMGRMAAVRAKPLTAKTLSQDPSGIRVPDLPEEVVQPTLDVAALRKNPSGARMADPAPPMATLTMGQAPAQADAMTPAARRKQLAAVGDQVMDDLARSGAMTPAMGPDVGRLRRAYKTMDEAVTFARESGDKRAIAAAQSKLDAYEDEIRKLAGKAGLDIPEKQFGRVVDDAMPATRPTTDPASLGAPSLVDDLDSLAPRPGATTIPDVDPRLLDLSTAGNRMTGRPGKFGDVEGLDLFALRERQALAAELKANRKLAQEALALGDSTHINAEAIGRLLKREPAEVLAGINRLDDYFESMRKAAMATDPTGEALRRLDKSLGKLNDSLEEVTGGLKLKDLESDVLVLATGSEALGKAEFKTDAASKLHDAAVLTKVMQNRGALVFDGAKSRKRGLLSEMATRAAARGGSRVGRGLVSKTGILADIASGGGAALAIHGTRALMQMTGAHLGKIGKIVGEVAVRGSKGIRPGALSAAWIMRNMSWQYNQDEKPAKPAGKPTLHDAFKARSAELAAVAANPDAAQLAIHNDLAPLRKLEPQVADELEMLSLSVPLYLAEHMPKDPGSVSRFGKSAWRPSDYEILAFGERMKGAVAPMDVFEEAMLSGKLHPHAAHALRTLHPRLYDKMQMEVFTRADELRGKLDHQAQVRISVLFETPVTSFMQPDFRRFMSERHLQRAEAAKPTGSMMGSSGSTSAAEPMTGAQQLLKQ